MHTSLVIVVGLVALVSGLEHYPNASVYRVVPLNTFQVSLLHDLQNTEGVDFWRGPDGVEHNADLMLTPSNREKVLRFLQTHNIQYDLMIPDVERLIENERQEQARAQLLQRSGPRQNRDEAVADFWNSYQRFQNHVNLLTELERQNPDIAKRIVFGKSYQGRDLNLIRIGIDSNDKKPVVFIQGGIHAREWISPATVTYFAQQLVNGAKDNDAAIVQLLKTFDFYIIPVINADGYEYTHTNSRLWRKTRRPSKSSPSCLGADPNRNFGFQWGGVGASTNPCSETFRGDSAFSEPETAAERDYINNNLKGRAKLYLAVHSYGQYWLFPWGYTSALTPDHNELNAKAQAGAKALAAKYGTKYTIGTSTNVLYAAAGGSDDWAYGDAGIKYSYTVELRDTGYYGFQLPASQIKPTGEETTAGFIAIAQEVAKTL